MASCGGLAIRPLRTRNRLRTGQKSLHRGYTRLQTRLFQAVQTRLKPRVPRQTNTSEKPPWYIGTLVPNKKHAVERVQTGVRLEKRLLKVLRAFAGYHDLTLGDLLEGIVLHAFDGKCPFNRASLRRIAELKKFYGLELNSASSHRLTEARTGKPSHDR